MPVLRFDMDLHHRSDVAQSLAQTETQASSGAVDGSTESDASKSQNPKRFECSHPGCNKRFTRAEHMQRHALNHTGGDSTCSRCSAHFKRPDLLERHMNRHREKDLEAGGPGRGTLDTRKRSWKAPDGAVVEKRPRHTEQEQEQPDAWIHGSSIDASLQVVSPPVSDEGRCETGGQQYRLAADNEDEFGACINGESNFFDPSVTTSRYCAPPDSDLRLQPSHGVPRTSFSPEHSQLEYHPVFQPDTASSFNMPYTTALDYNWLFNLEAATSSGFGLASGRAEFHDQSFQVNNRPGPGLGATQMSNLTSPEQPVQPQNTAPESQNDTSWRPWAEESLHDAPVAQAPLPRGTSPPSSAPSNASLQQSQPHPARQIARHPAAETTGERYMREREPRFSRAAAITRDKESRKSRPNMPSRTVEPERPLSMLRIPETWPHIDQAIREKLVMVIEAANPSIPGHVKGSLVRDHPLLSLDSLQSWLDLFFTHFNTAYPLIHLPTFEPSHAEPLLLLSILLLGATYSDDWNAHQLAVCIHDVMRPGIFAHAGFSPRSELWTLQTILLVECFGKSRAGQNQHDMSHLFHGLLINLIRRSDCQSIGPLSGPPHEAPSSTEKTGSAAMDKAWRRWSEAEQKKRLALLCFMWDTQHAVLFCQSLCMSAFELRISMPCGQSIWEAPDAGSWAIAWHRSSPSAVPSPSTSPDTSWPMFLPVLKTYLTPTPAGHGAHGRQNLNALSRILVLHGLMSIAWDMQRRDQTSLGVVTVSGVASWKDLISKAYDRWKVDFDQYCRDAASSTLDDGTKTEFAAFASAYRTVYHAAQALLHMEFLDLQIYAGATHILGRPVQVPQDYRRSAQVVKRWAMGGQGGRSQAAAIATWHAAQVLSELTVTVTKGDSRRDAKQPCPTAAAGLTSLFHVSWCIYLATLTCWAFHHAKPRGTGKIPGESRERSAEDDQGFVDDDSDGSDEMVWDPMGEMETLIRTMAGPHAGDAHTAVRYLLATQGRRRTHGLIKVVADMLTKVRWGIVHGGITVLRGLVPQRLINQYEAS